MEQWIFNPECDELVGLSTGTVIRIAEDRMKDVWFLQRFTLGQLYGTKHQITPSLNNRESVIKLLLELSEKLKAFNMVIP